MGGDRWNSIRGRQSTLLRPADGHDDGGDDGALLSSFVWRVAVVVAAAVVVRRVNLVARFGSARARMPRWLEQRPDERERCCCCRVALQPWKWMSFMGKNFFFFFFFFWIREQLCLPLKKVPKDHWGKGG
jgi:hypothetical protein